MQDNKYAMLPLYKSDSAKPACPEKWKVAKSPSKEIHSFFLFSLLEIRDQIHSLGCDGAA